MSFLKKPQTQYMIKRVRFYRKKGKEWRDAIELASLEVGGLHPMIVTMAINKYLEADNPRTPLAKQGRDKIDAMAFASMGRLWDNDNFSDPNALSSEQDAWVQSLYLLLRYNDKTMKQVIHISDNLPGNSAVRKKIIKELFDE